MIRLLLVVVSLMLGTAGALACEEYKSLSTDEMKDYRDKLVEQDADPLDQLFAFEGLACSDSPAVRSYAMRAALEASADPIVRNRVVLEALLQRSRIDMEVAVTAETSQDDKEFIKARGGVFSYEVRFVSQDQGCLSLNQYDECDPDYALFIRGATVDISTPNDGLQGQLQLTHANELVGYVTRGRGKIAAVIKLF